MDWIIFGQASTGLALINSLFEVNVKTSDSLGLHLAPDDLEPQLTVDSNK